MRPAAIVWSLILPGLGHALLRRYVRAVLLLVGFGAAIDAIIISRLWLRGLLPGVLFWQVVALAAAIWTYSALSIIRLAFLRHRQSAISARDRIFKRALDLYLQDRYNEARDELQRLLKLDPEDVEAHLYLSHVEAETGRSKQAIRHVTKAKRLDVDGKWEMEIARRARALRAGLTSAGNQDESG